MFQEQYSEVVRNKASIELKITKCTTIGPPRIGKTCLKNLLTGQEWDVEGGTASTDVMEAPEWVECYSVEDGGAGKLWKLLSKEQQQEELIRSVATSGTQQTTTPSPATSPSDVPSTTKSSDAPSTSTPNDHPLTTIPSDAPPTTTPADAPPTTTPSDHPLTTIPSDATPTTTPSDIKFTTTPSFAPPPSTKPYAAQKPATVQQAVEALASACSCEALQDFLKDKAGKVLGETRLVHFIDTGGQAVYHDVHPVLITSPSVYLVVFSLEDFYQKGDKEQLMYFRSDLIQRPLRSIFTLGMKNPRENHLLVHPEAPTIFIVGTHLDKIPKDKCKKFLVMLHKMISKEIGNKPYREFVQYDPKGQSFWAVDNTLAGREQDEEFKKYISKLRKMVQEKSMEMSVKVPLPWMLLKVVMEGKGVRYCKYSELLEEACIRGYIREESPEADLDSMLKLFHILGLFYHKVPKGYKKEDSLVFIDPDCLYSATSDFLMAAKEEIEDSQGGDEERQHQTEAATKEEIADSQGGSEGGQHQTQAATMEETEDNQGGSEGGQHQTQAVTKVETEGSQGSSEQGRHQTQSAATEGRHHDGELAGRQWMLEPGRIVGKQGIIRRMEGNVDSIKQEVEILVQIIDGTNARIDRVSTDLELGKLHAQLKEIGQRHRKDAMQCPDASFPKAKRHLFICRLVHSLASSVKAVLDDSGRKGDVHHVRREVARTVENVLAHCQSRSIHSNDMDQFLAILSDLRIIAQLSDMDHYVVPAALPKVPHSMQLQVVRSAGLRGNATAILFTVVSQTIMEVCYLPSGLFCCLISELVTEAGWTVNPLGCTHVAFTHRDLIGRVHVIEHESYIEIKLESEESLEELNKTCQAVREKLHKHVVNVYKNLYSDPTADTRFEESLVWGFHCGEHPGDETHIAAFHEDGSGCYAECLLQGCSVLNSVTPAQLVWASDSSLCQPLKVTADVDFRIAKCVTIQIQDVKAQLEPIEKKWVQYMQYVTPEKTQPLSISQKSDWKLADNGHVLLQIDIPNQQVYPLPLLITPGHCVYLIMFDLPEEKEEEKKVLMRIHNTLKDVYTYSSCGELVLNEGLCHRPKTFLVGLQREEMDKCSLKEQLRPFAQRLKQMLEMRSYEKLIVFPEGGYPYWTGAERSIHDNPALLRRIQCYSWQPTQFVHQLLQCHCELLKHFTEVGPFVLYEDVEAKMTDVVSGTTESSNFEEFLNLLHCFGLIFYRSLPNLAQSENVVVLQPECLYQLFAQVQELSKERERISIADLFTAAATPVQHVQKWFQAVCIDMNLVIELPIGNSIGYVFVMGLEPQFNPPSQAHYSINPLLVTFRSEDFVREGGNCFLPSSLFPAFVTTFLKELKEYVMQQNKGSKQLNFRPKATKQHWHVRIHVEEQGAADIHVVERDSWIEIGLQQFHTKTVDQMEDQQLEKLQLFYQAICSIVSKSAEGVRDRLRLSKPSIHYGFHVCHSKDSAAVECFGQFDPKYGTLTCSCCNAPQDPTPQQQIWFSKVDHQMVRCVLCIDIVMVSGHDLQSFEVLQ